MCDCNNAGDKDNRLNVTGYCIYVNGCLVSWKSRAQRSQTLSSAEAEYVALSEICSEILFARMIMEFLGEKVKYPITVYCNNLGAMYLAYNKEISRRTKNVDTKAHFGQNYVENGTMKKILPDQKTMMRIFFRKICQKLRIINTPGNS